MHLALLMTNTDESDFARRHPKDGEKFSQMIGMVRPTWKVTSYSVKDGIFPTDLTQYDGVMISGSPASVHDPDPWIRQLFDLIKDIHFQRIPMFGACFGHQAIAMALGGQVGKNPDGWVFGLTEARMASKPEWMHDMPDTFRQYGAHIEQVITLPKGAAVLSESDSCPVAGFHIGQTIFTTQNHPEMTSDFFAALVEEYGPKLPSDVAQRARASTHQVLDGSAYAHSIACFFELATENNH